MTGESSRRKIGGTPPPPPVAATPGPVEWLPPVPGGGLGNPAIWPSINPTPPPHQAVPVQGPSRAIKDKHIKDVSTRKLTAAGIKVYRSTAQSVDDDTAADITYDTVEWRRDFSAPAASFTSVAVPYAGLYDITAMVEFAADADGYRAVDIEINTTAVEGIRQSATPALAWRGILHTQKRLNAGDTVGVNVKHTAGAATNVTEGANKNSLTVTYRGQL